MAGISHRLGELEITSLLIEGGAMINWASASRRNCGQGISYYAPKILAGTVLFRSLPVMVSAYE